MHNVRQSLFTGAALACLASSALAGTTQLDYEIQQGVQSGFGFSVLHMPNPSRGGTAIIARIIGTFGLEFDDNAQTIQFNNFSADLFEENDLNPADFGMNVGSLSFVSSSVFGVGSGGVVGGDLTLNLATTSPGFGGDIVFHFAPNAFNALANSFDTSDFSVGLWGVGDLQVRGDDEEHHGRHHDDDGYRVVQLGIDLYGEHPDSPPHIVPLPSGAAIGFAGMGLIGAQRRRRRQAATC